MNLTIANNTIRLNAIPGNVVNQDGDGIDLNIGANADQVRLVVVHGFGYRLMNMTNPAADNP